MKDRYGRRRPYIGNDAPICIARGTSLDSTASYPSGHTTIGWTIALLLTELAPDRAAEILARGRSFGESRIVCGVHWLSDVQAGTLNGATLVAAVHSSPEFRSDMQQAGREIAAARRHPARRPTRHVCRRGRRGEPFPAVRPATVAAPPVFVTFATTIYVAYL